MITDPPEEQTQYDKDREEGHSFLNDGLAAERAGKERICNLINIILWIPILAIIVIFIRGAYRVLTPLVCGG